MLDRRKTERNNNICRQSEYMGNILIVNLFIRYYDNVCNILFYFLKAPTTTDTIAAAANILTFIDVYLSVSHLFIYFI